MPGDSFPPQDLGILAALLVVLFRPEAFYSDSFVQRLAFTEGAVIMPLCSTRSSGSRNVEEMCLRADGTARPPSRPG